MNLICTRLWRRFQWTLRLCICAPRWKSSTSADFTISRYERILSRLCGDGKTINQRITIRILQWMLVARRPLRRCELESGVTLHGQVSQITTSTKPRGDVLSLCYPILEAADDPGSSVNFIHFTVLESVYTRYLSRFKAC